MTSKIGRMTVEIVNGRVEFRAEDGRTMFAVTPLSDGTSIDVRAIEDCEVDRIYYSARLAIEPQVSNVVVVRCLPDRTTN